ncbi:MAG TPA: PfkB family carbohydrate kinase [Chitinophagaceae bacterium]|jgi:rfaE bifunctional protein kinase chain/domain|nr:PfkB family carbohydrate kinase [Chitinophagaceae bacterium]
MESFQKLFESFTKLKVGVIGDVMLDTYMWGSVDRISPEAPVPVVSLKEKEYRIGGAGNVALNCHSLGSQVFILSVVGDDTEGLLLEELFHESLIDTSYLIKSPSRITTNKTRIISRNQQMMRLDSEMAADIDQGDEEALLQQVRSFIQTHDPNVMIFEDYNKGVLTEKIIHEVLTICKQAGVITAVDPKRKNFFSYHNADIFKPNLIEVKQGLNLLFDELNDSLLSRIHLELRNILEHDISFITLSEKGVFYQQDGSASIIPSHLRNIADVSGAGDTVIAVAALVYTATKDVHLMAEIANIAGGLVCEEVGTVAIDKSRLQSECELLLA